jgi:geranylgeranyl reductase family protein
MDRTRFDVVIVGGGPAGAWCAHQLAAGGVRVALCDGSHPREKACGGGVTARALALVGHHPAAPGAPIDSATFSYGDRRAHLALAGDGSQLQVFSRRDFDSALLSRAAATGAEIVPHRATDIVSSGSAWLVTTNRRQITADWLIGADGANSFVRRRLSVPFARADLSIACGYYVLGESSRRIDIEFVSQPAGYLWSFPRPDHLAVGVCAQADETSVAALLPIVDGWIRRHVPPGRSLQRYSWPIPSLRPAALERERPCGVRWLLLGDAAGLVDPITREGIFFALQSAAFAAAALLSGRDAAVEYADRVRDTIYAELLLAARLKARFYRPAFMSLLVRGLQRSHRVGGVMTDLIAGEQPYHSLRSRLLKTLEVRLMWDLLRLQRT